MFTEEKLEKANTMVNGQLLMVKVLVLGGIINTLKLVMK